MSVVAVRIYKDKIVIGADSFVGFSYDSQLKDKDVKLFEQNEIVIGGVGYAKDISLIKLFSRDRKPARDDEDAIIDFIAEFKEWAAKKDKDYTLETDFMIIYQDRAWFVSAGLYIKEIKKYRAMGAGQNMAQASLYLDNTVEKSLNVACELSIYCEKPLNIIEKKLKKGGGVL